MAKRDRYKLESTVPMKKGGKRLGTRVFFKKANSEERTTKVYLNPYGKGRKYAAELRDNVHYTNSGALKTDNDGGVRPLTKEQRGYRAGYLAARKDSAAVWKASKKK